MCGIFCYVGGSGQKNAAEIVLAGLKRLDYRGYDSWGIAVAADNKVSVEKKVGKISDISTVQLPASAVGLAHTRWATTGAVTQVNAHPHYSADKSFVLAQNGIVENYLELKKELQKKGHTFISQTDTEVIVRFIEEKLKTVGDLKKAVAAAFLELKGRNTIVLLTKEGKILAARNGSPLVIGLHPQNGEIFLSSDTLSFADKATEMITVDNGQMVEINGNDIHLFEIRTGAKLSYHPAPIGFTNNKVDKEGFDHFMLKEIQEAPFVLHQLIKQDPLKYQQLAGVIKKAKHVYTIGSGGAGVAAAQVAYYLRSIGKVNAVSLIGADSTEYFDLFTKNDLIIAISQSGETADVLEVLEIAHEKQVKIASFVNMPGSMMTRMSTYSFMAESGPEICVMSTKTFDAQVAFGYLLAKTVADEGEDARQQLQTLALKMSEYFKDHSNMQMIKKIADHLSHKKDIFLLAKSQNFQIIREGMVKIIEAAYLHGHALPAGDLKHYVITLMEPGVPVIAVIANDAAQADMFSAINEVRLRGAEVIALSPIVSENFDYHLPVPDVGEVSAIFNLLPLQLLAYYLAVRLGNNIDKPRNIAKSVTVK
jgi:glucosamine--fructose-6-phosphate aminotransferase (isomerizing)